MKTAPIHPAEIRFDHPDHPGLAYAEAYGDIYHARLGALAQARHVFLGGNGLPGRWQGRRRFVVLETGFGLGHNFLATWAAWRADPQRCGQLVFVSVDKHPPRAEDLPLAHAHLADDPALCELAGALAAAWPPSTPDLHRLDFEQGQVQLLLAWGEAGLWLPELVAPVDAFYLDGFAPSRNEAMWDARLFKSCARLAVADATAATWSVAQPVRQALTAAGFALERAPGFGTKRDMLIARRHQPVAAPAPPGRRRAPQLTRPGDRDVLVIGAGLAGATAAQALAREGLAVRVLDRHLAPAQETSGNLAGLFHGVLHAQDGAHAQLLRAAALRAAQVYRPLITQGLIPGHIGAEPSGPGATAGLLRLAAGSTPASLQALLAAQGLPSDYVQALDSTSASQAAGLPLSQPAWHYPGGGWLQPGALVRHWLQCPGVQWQGGQAVARLQAQPGSPADAPRWQALNAQGELLAEADVVVVAGAHSGLDLLRPWTDVTQWPLGRQRGQVTQLDPAQAEALGLSRPALPLASGAYLIALPEALGGGLLCGATQQPGDEDAQLRAADHAENLAKLAAWLRPTPGANHLDLHPDRAPGLDLARLAGRVGWRLSAPDRLPVLGPVPLGAAALVGQRRLEQARQVPRVPGLYLLSGLGSRGITLAPLLGELLAAWITGAPWPLAASLVDALDVARFGARAVAKGSASASAVASASPPI